MIDATDEWVARQRQRWMRPNAQLYLREDHERFLPPAEAQKLRDERKFEADIDASRRLLAVLRREVSDIRRILHERKYRPDQPRVPAGNPDGGQWTFEDGHSSETELLSAASRKRGDGHHYIPRGVFKKYNLPEDTRKVFEQARSGPLYDTRSNKWDKEHRIYNDAVEERFDEFKGKRKIRVEQMTPAQARTFLGEVYSSTDMRIRNYNMAIQMREIMFRILRGRGGGSRQ
jgi:hypothetical protein